ncbi:MAG: hypothetical protein QM500_12315 [Methylococcales bacterium]
MGLMCECDSDWYPEPGEWIWTSVPSKYAPLPFKKSKRCCSCNELVSVGALAVEHPRARIPDTDIEVRIYGDDGEIPIASEWMCESCGDLFFSLSELGYCMNPREDMRDLVKQYAAEHSAQN